MEYGVAVVKGATEPEAAQAFIDGLLEGAGAKAMGERGVRAAAEVSRAAAFTVAWSPR